MKRYSNILIFVLTIALISSACNREPAIESDASFTISGLDSLRAGTPIEMIFEGQGDFVSVYSGTETRIYGEPGAKGVRLTADEYTFTYSKAGEYVFTVVASSYGDWSEEEIIDVKSQTLVVEDDRNEFIQFKFKGFDDLGEILGNDIVFSFSDAVDITTLKADWILNSDDAQVFIDNVLQEDAKSSYDYSNPVVMDVVSPNGIINSYTITVNTYPANSETEILSFGSSDPDRMAEIDAVNREIHLKVPPGTKLSALSVYAIASEGASVKNGIKSIISSPFSHNVSNQPTVLTVTAEDGTKEDWNLYTKYELTFRSFDFLGLNPPIIGVIDSTNLTVDLKVLEGTAIESLVPTFTLSDPSTVKVGSVVQTSGVTANDFSEPVTYSLIDADNDTFNFRVKVQVVSK